MRAVGRSLQSAGSVTGAEVVSPFLRSPHGAAAAAAAAARGTARSLRPLSRTALAAGDAEEVKKGRGREPSKGYS